MTCYEVVQAEKLRKYYELYKLCSSELYAITLGQDVAEMQNFSATVDWLGPSGSNRVITGQNWVKHGSNVDHVGRPGHVGHSANDFV